MFDPKKVQFSFCPGFLKNFILLPIKSRQDILGFALDQPVVFFTSTYTTSDILIRLMNLLKNGNFFLFVLFILHMF